MYTINKNGSCVNLPQKLFPKLTTLSLTFIVQCISKMRRKIWKGNTSCLQNSWKFNWVLTKRRWAILRCQRGRGRHSPLLWKHTSADYFMQKYSKWNPMFLSYWAITPSSLQFVFIRAYPWRKKLSDEGRGYVVQWKLRLCFSDLITQILEKSPQYRTMNLIDSQMEPVVRSRSSEILPCKNMVSWQCTAFIHVQPFILLTWEQRERTVTLLSSYR